MVQSVIGVVAGVLAFIAFIPYIVSIFKGETKPHRATFAIWSAISLVTVSSYFASGARETIWIALVYATLQLFIFVLSFRYGVGGWSRLDIICLSGAGIGIVAWIITNNPATALYASIASDALGYVPLFKKAYMQPETESFVAWAIGLVAACLNLFAVTTLRLDIILYPIYGVLGDGIIVLLLVLAKRRLRAKGVRAKVTAEADAFIADKGNLFR